MTAAGPAWREYRPRWSRAWARVTLRSALATSPCAVLAFLCVVVDFDAWDQDPARYGALDVAVLTGCLVAAAAFAVGGCARTLDAGGLLDRRRVRWAMVACGLLLAGFVLPVVPWRATAVGAPLYALTFPEVAYAVLTAGRVRDWVTRALSGLLHLVAGYLAGAVVFALAALLDTLPQPGPALALPVVALAFVAGHTVTFWGAGLAGGVRHLARWRPDLLPGEPLP